MRYAAVNELPYPCPWLGTAQIDGKWAKNQSYVRMIIAVDCYLLDAIISTTVVSQYTLADAAPVGHSLDAVISL